MFVMSLPANSMVPPVGSSSRNSVRPAVDLPQPDSPTRPTVSPGHRLRSIPSTALTGASTCLTSVCRYCGKCFCSPVIFKQRRAGEGRALDDPAGVGVADDDHLVDVDRSRALGVVGRRRLGELLGGGIGRKAVRSVVRDLLRHPRGLELGARRHPLVGVLGEPSPLLRRLLGGQLVVVRALRGRAGGEAAVFLSLLRVVVGSGGRAEDVALAAVLALLRVVGLVVVGAHGVLLRAAA